MIIGHEINTCAHSRRYQQVLEAWIGVRAEYLNHLAIPTFLMTLVSKPIKLQGPLFKNQ